MLTLPVADPGTPPLTTPRAYLWWQARRQKGLLAASLLFGIVGNVGGALMPWALGRVVDSGLDSGLSRELFLGCALIAAIGLAQVAANVWGHRFDVLSWLRSAFNAIQLIGYHSTRTGDAVTAEMPTGEVVSTVASDALRIGDVFSVVSRFVGGIVAYGVVAVLMLRMSVPLGLLVLFGLPLVVGVLALLVRPLQKRQAAQREAQGRLTTLGADTVSGLRILRGIGGEEIFAGRYAKQSQQVREAGVRVAQTQSLLDATQTLLPGLFLTVLVWAGARMAIAGDITPGQLVMFYGFAAFLTQPLWSASEMMRILARAAVGVRRIIKVLSVPTTEERAGATAPAPPPGTEIVDEASGVRVPAHGTIALVSADPDETAGIAMRLGHFVSTEKLPDDAPADDDVPSGAFARLRALLRRTASDDDVWSRPTRFADPPRSTVRWGRRLLHELNLLEVRDRIVVAESTPTLFSGTLDAELDVRGHATREQLLEAMHVADAADVLDSVPGGLDGRVEEKGRSLSGGQRQRVALARALLTYAEVLVLVEPTSAVDAHTEARIAERLATARAGRATVIVTTSPLVLDRVDEVLFIENGVVRMSGPHRELLRRDDEDGDRYRRVVSRAAADSPAETPGTTTPEVLVDAVVEPREPRDGAHEPGTGAPGSGPSVPAGAATEPGGAA